MWVAVAGTALGMILLGARLVLVHRTTTMLRTENERWRSLARERADRVAMLSHELRTPLALVSGATELLSDRTTGPLTTGQAALVETVGVNAKQMNNLAEDLLTEARIDAGIFSMHTQTVNIRTVVRKAVQDLRELHPNTIIIDTPGAPPRIPGDPQLIRQALVNLVTNAARHAGGDAEITVRARRADDGVLLSVSDNGSGMSPQQRQTLFARTMEGKSASGNGLGLLITKKIVELHGGRCVVDTVATRGTTMIISLPGARPTPESAEAT